MESTPWSLNRIFGTLIDKITTIISFVVVIIIILSAILYKLLPYQEKDSTVNVHIIYAITATIILIVMVVCGCIIFSPKNLIYDKEALLRHHGKPPFGTSEKTDIKPKISKTRTTPNTKNE